MLEASILKVTGMPALDWPSGTVTVAFTVTSFPTTPWVDFVSKTIAVGITEEIPVNVPITVSDSFTV